LREQVVVFMLYVAAGSIGVLVLYILLVQYALYSPNMILIGAVAIVISTLFGYAISRYLLEPKQDQDDSLLHLTKETLHELNIPLSTIDINTKMLKKSLQHSAHIRQLDRIEHSLTRLRRLYEKLSYKIKKEIYQIPKEKFRVDRLIEQRVEEFRAHGRNQIILNLQHVSICADKIGFEQMLDNLLSNAIKYSPKHKPITVILERDRVAISDNGCGMDEVELLSIYERYYRADRLKSGSGIGLCIVKEYCDSEQIGIEIVSKKGVGTKVVLSLSATISSSNPDALNADHLKIG